MSSDNSERVFRPTLRERMAEQLRSKEQEIAQAAASFGANFDFASLYVIFQRALELRVISAQRYFVDIPNSDYKLRTVAIGDADPARILVEICSNTFRSVSEPFEWHRTVEALDVAAYIARELQRLGALPEGDRFDPDGIFHRLVTKLVVYIRMRTEGRYREIGEIIYAPNDVWAVTEYGIEALQDSYFVHHSRLNETDWLWHISRKAWTNYDEVAPAFGAARLLFESYEEREDDLEIAADDTFERMEARMRLPRIFIASSTEGLFVANALQENLDHQAEPTVWTQDIFNPSEFTIESLSRASESHDYGVFVLTPDDTARMRGNEVNIARDNVIFELGLFIGRLGFRRCFLIMPRGEEIHLPTDLIGITPLRFNSQRVDGNIVAALGPVANQLLRTIGKVSVPTGSNADVDERA